ncbi:ABC transporter related protein OS=Tsukamurella paurometabola (strain ATCC 8368 / DSM / CCUG 35730 / CIP 100753 / JCM 10117 / KCTC 9821 / NBRC 16120 / NCIMB 702349 / NCTC 13040) OX=521096 GN=Tpau_0791 PE=4 SV=1 [Tsukamurella paurometabola]|uniref:ABC transporter related protein n=1 Tax=Tsukamurella paurometabola (strain ATCC 8368 / DSM 20162 / CCUG 35730 / CIP 100753 / JCM 10117 / KCTC 9821 / NBRC 16120 / NCIMB 702349 / NCTC 13040) TaxID=521096 RepID=D5UTS3_TSUPD|nr:amino acid ABC transporter ATP-binding protein [Tsukamurella paurometabola]ADG77427.1 ABC transporter related protein [Tsukamurella paurometabola DSM 20162]SUP27001.1 L-cystine import ATP-binding protein TcyC [Tsukamurella paurometabola]
MTDLVAVQGLTKSFGDVEVLRGIDFTVAEGTVTVIIGPSGSGKTTVLRSLNALELPDAGTVTVGTQTVDFGAGAPGKAALAAYRAQSAMVFQSHNLFPHKTALQNVTEGPVVVQKRPAGEAEREARELLARVGLADHAEKYPHQLSGGQQQRVGIARALALRPKVVLFDEPTSALDPELVGDVLTVMRDLATEGRTMVVVTHEMAFARDVADQVLFVDRGAVLEAGRPADVIGAPTQERTREFLDRILNPL